ncbi:hypothetical protein BASA50_006338 [Batrachochytrium salamandrivorans]|uniref:F-box domain-containing protein n=1 Tax=Batrachochytrium salamandrivorans TaxID=1357716 RepID=A0ABQ8F9Y2_9FUNG|nr:hypothetical protein BASA50_006338 [Batrachochytrium salamandrivorans]KAH9267491.1 hypothetical protein BASA84_000638 [Batrachochytrium salamandrivorans]KAH9276588.1 hypothetical protein BASA83_000717 [Batrachochytrium salamandrivorans]
MPLAGRTDTGQDSSYDSICDGNRSRNRQRCMDAVYSPKGLREQQRSSLQTAPAPWKLLPLELLLQTLSYLPYTDVLHCGQTCRFWQGASAHASVWQRLCREYQVPLDNQQDQGPLQPHPPVDAESPQAATVPEVVAEEPEEEEGAATTTITTTTTTTTIIPSMHTSSFQATFKTHATEYNGFLHDYQRMAPLCTRFQMRLRQGSPIVLQSLHAPSPVSVYRSLLKDFLHIRSVRQLILLYVLMGRLQPHSAPGLFGSFHVYQYQCSYRLADPFLVHDHMGGRYLGFLSGTLVCNRVICLVDSLSVCGHLVNICPDAEKYNYDLGEFADFFATFVFDVEQGKLCIHKDTGISLFPEYGIHTFSSPASNGVSVSVSVTSFGDLIADVHKGFAYRISISFDPLASKFEFVQLQERSWIFQYQSGYSEDINGPGVVGQFPIFNAANTSMVYQSCCPELSSVDDTLVSMGGFFTMKGTTALGVTSTFIVPINPFRHQLPPSCIELYQCISYPLDAEED